MAKRIIQIYYNTVNRYLTDADDNPIVQDLYPRIFENEKPRVHLTLRGYEGTAATAYQGLSASDTINAALDDDFDGATAVMAKTTSASINYGAWADESKTAGKLAIDMDGSRAEFDAALGTAEEKLCTFEVRAAASGETWPSAVFQMPMYAAALVDEADIT